MAVGGQEASYEPTPEEIAEQCAIFRAGWSDAEHEQRMRERIDPVRSGIRIYRERDLGLAPGWES